MTNFAGQSQSIDTICFPVATIKKVLIAAEQKKVLDGQVIVLNDRISILQNIIDKQIDKDSATVGSYERQLSVMREEKAIYIDQIKTFEKLLRKEKRKRIFTGLAGVATTSAMIFLSLKK